MNRDIFCLKHNIAPTDEQWKVILEELTNPDDQESEAFKGQVCPVCFIHLKDRVKDLKRSLKVESRQAVALRAQNGQLQKIMDAVVETVKQLTGRDAYELASSVPEGDLLNILPNLIVEVAHAGRTQKPIPEKADGK